MNLTLAIGITRRANTLLGGASMGASGRTDDVIFEHTLFGDAVCDGVPVPAGGYNVDASIPHVLLR